MDNNLLEEANAFDKQIIERVENGHIPDLRRSGRCEYFYSNVWRDQYFANLYYGELVTRIVADIKLHSNKNLKKITLLEVGCGPGHVSLELARYGLNVTGLDISLTCVDIAQKIAKDDPYSSDRGILNYICSDFLAIKEQFDVILFTAALHHFPNCNEIIKHAKKILNKNGLIIADEPIRDHVMKKNAAIIYLVKTLLSITNSYYKKIEMPQNVSDCLNAIEKIYHEEKYEMEDGSKVQSVNDNEANFEVMYNALTANFTTLVFEKKHAIYHQLIGGIRLKNIEDEHQFAKFLKMIDALLCEYNILNPTNFYFFGKKVS